jgi:hypothetical protein
LVFTGWAWEARELHSLVQAKGARESRGLSFGFSRVLIETCVEKPSRDTKVKVYKRIGQAILPNLFDIQPGVVADRIKSKIERWALAFNINLFHVQHWILESFENV